jgi:hypothetical protein
MLDLRLSFFLSLFLLVLGCKISTEPIGEGIPIDINIVADGFGDHNGSASSEELDFIIDYFHSNQKAWIIGQNAVGFETYEVKSIPSDTVVKFFKRNRLIGPYTSENNLRQELEGLSFLTPFVGIYVLTRHSECLIIRYFRSPGPTVSQAEWEEFKIIL